MKRPLKAEFKTDSLDLLNFIIKHFRTYLITAIVAATLSAGVSLLIKPLYESSVILYPSANIAGAGSLLSGDPPGAALFGGDDATEKLLQVINSDQVRDWLKERWDLVNHYNIRPGERYPNTRIAEKMEKQIRCRRTSYGSVEIRVRDRDREVASAMANAIAARTDTIFNTLRRNNASAILGEINRSYKEQEQLVREYEDSLIILGGAATLRIYSTLETESEYLGLIRGKYLETMAQSHQTLPYTIIVDQAVVAEKKAYPKRLLMVVVSTTSVLLLLTLVLFVAGSMTLSRSDDRQ